MFVFYDIFCFFIIFFFFFNDTATTEIYTLSLHDALSICCAIVASSRFDSPLKKGTSLSCASNISPLLDLGSAGRRHLAGLRLAQALDQRGEQRPGDVRVVADERAERPRRHRRAAQRALRVDRRHPVVAVDQS